MPERYLAGAGDVLFRSRSARGTNMRIIPGAVLTDLEVTLPCLDVQRRVVALDGLARRERTLSIHAA